MGKTSYFPAKEVEEIANELIEKYHRHIIDFGVKVEYSFTDKTSKSKGVEVWGTCRKISGVNSFLADPKSSGDPFFCIVISKEIWDILPYEKRVALVDHELCHVQAEVKQQKEEADGDSDMETDNPIKLSIRPHDMEEFSCIVKRHGLWREGIESFIEAAKKSQQGKDESD